MAITIYYPQHEEPIQLWRIPHGIAHALSPAPAPEDDPDALLIGVYKKVAAPLGGAPDNFEIQELTDADRELLRRIWHVSDSRPLPIDTACREARFDELRRQIEASPERPAWDLFGEFCDWAQKQLKKNADLQRKHWGLLARAMREGKLHPLTSDHAPARSVGEAQLVTLQEARAHLLPLGFVLVPRAGVEESPYSVALPDVDEFAGADVAQWPSHEEAASDSSRSVLADDAEAVDGRSPDPLTREQIASAFGGVWKSAAEWALYLSKGVPRWLMPALAVRAAPRAKAGHRWNPVSFAELLRAKKGISDETLNRAFRIRNELASWRPAWQQAQSAWHQFDD